MGLDSVELVMAVEEAFGFSIPDDEAGGLDTVGKLYGYILEHRFHGPQEACLSSVTFYRLRRAMMKVLGIPRAAVRVSTELATLIPAKRRRVWCNLRDAVALRLPELERPWWVVILVSAATIGLAAATGAVLLPELYMAAGFVAVLVAVLVGWGLVRLTTPLAVEFRKDCATVGSLTKEILARNFGTIADECGHAGDNEVWEALRTIIVGQLGVSPSDVTKEASFVKDLHVD